MNVLKFWFMGKMGDHIPNLLTQFTLPRKENVIIARCLKITEKVSFNIASGASYVYILSGQKLNKKCQKCQKWSIWRVFWKHEACGQTVLPDRSVLIGHKLAENAKIEKYKCDILGNFQTMCFGLKYVCFE